jgi:hypothetical protein
MNNDHRNLAMPPPDQAALSPPPGERHLEITAEDVAAAFRPWVDPNPASPSDPASPRLPDADPLDPLFLDDTLLSLVQALPAGATDPAESKLRRKFAAMHLLRSLDARQPVEAALATQAVLFHYASLAALRRATRSPPHSSMSAGYETASAARASTLFCRLLHELSWKQQPRNPLPARNKPRWRH